ncbi:MAG: helix-turn-helix domain-containing protein [Devosia sp.]
MLPVQCKMARTALGLGVRDLAKLAGDMSPDTIARLERGEQLRDSTVAKIVAAFEAAGVEFVNREDGKTGVLLTEMALSRPE